MASSFVSPPQILHRRLLPLPPRSQNPNPSRRSLLLLSSISAAGAASLLKTPDPAIAGAADSSESAAVTDRVFMDFGVCPSYFRSDRLIGSDLAACPDSEPIGRVVFGLYGKILPQTVANFKAICSSGAYKGTLIHKILQGQFFGGGRQGRRDKGEV